MDTFIESNYIPKYEILDIGTLSAMSEKIDWGLIDSAIPKLWEKNRGENINVMVVDTGIIHHEDLEENVLWDKAKSFVPNEDYIDGNGHGTMVAGVISALDSELGIVGVAPKSKIIPVKVLSNHGRLSRPDALELALNYAIEIKPDIINMSLGNKYPLSSEFERLMSILYSMNIPIVCAMGNYGKKYDCYPAKYAKTIAVTSYNKNRNISSFSSKSLEADFALPGEEILTTALDNQYSIVNGTSFASPFLCGIIAIILSSAKSKNISYTVNDIKKILIDSTIDLGPVGRDDFFGNGIINSEALAKII